MRSTKEEDASKEDGATAQPSESTVEEKSTAVADSQKPRLVNGPTAGGDAENAPAAPSGTEVQPGAQPQLDAHPRPGSARKLRVLLAVVLILAGAGGYGAYWFLWVRGTVSTDDAYVEAPIVSVASRLPERVEEVLVKEGQQVKRGQILVRFASDLLAVQVAQAQAAVHGAEALLEEKRNSPRPEEIEVARAEVRVEEVELTLQEKEVARAVQLAKVKAISAQELERRRSALAGARSRLEVSRLRFTLLAAGPPPQELRQAEANLEMARGRLESARISLADAQLEAPSDGVIAKRMVDSGEVVQKGQALFQIVESGKSWVVANLEEDQISRVHEGQPVRLWIDAYPGREFQGRVGPIYAATLSRFSLLPSSSASGSFIKVTQRIPVRIDWASEDLPPMYPGLNVIVRIRTE